MSRRRNPRIFLTAVVASSLLAASYKLYDYYVSSSSNSKNLQDPKKYTKKSIALTLSHSILSSQLPLDEILLNSENVTFILPPNLSVDDLEGNFAGGEAGSSLPRALLKNYKLLNCSNFQGYFDIIKNLKPDMLLVCSDDLGIRSSLPSDLSRFAKEIVEVDQNAEDITTKLMPLFVW
ncbi:peroxisome assembly protein 22 [Yamadazyma tenuis]|uniref:Peroxisome assembly protein 22 n=1 Tax=Candida tenuis (strain ATCC 10573 / BCRC 21748 / CBS 615 / JCM 9827 / NBRC 10315 / NRRL Y-1498 / VKM Y-70) TaxID=590646 RepID=G3B2E7_CANTC|nr:uncharacterized protein CANTEDRAFT_113444 [Yamadazyma tenuis ATCC 10573]XP_006685890.1 uncharacterized protein CANTEDRAFT_113444 [Yamadazyma tenuis ATCC 10573]EGV65083.1 hypothetical protein CANTEDRAFT_113444 [Yamadazyma tenuis ATCC 10573]EGV65084.1 hypothetical protein CANTEDRAFT_113444 [Yamadazyma tenuis ATCC 10573]WEJ97444.1 peroxisome assembly protein 22 [Yamadazyma tenuis]